jgi:hypothetical protein
VRTCGTCRSPETSAVDGYARPSGWEAGIWRRGWKRRRREGRGLLGLRGCAGPGGERIRRDVRRCTSCHDVDGSVFFFKKRGWIRVGVGFSANGPVGLGGRLSFQRAIVIKLCSIVLDEKQSYCVSERAQIEVALACKTRRPHERRPFCTSHRILGPKYHSESLYPQFSFNKCVIMH